MTKGITREQAGRARQSLLRAAIDQLGGDKAVAEKLSRLGFGGADGEVSLRSVRTWTSGQRKPDVDVLLVLVALTDESIVEHLARAQFESEMARDVDGLKQEVTALRKRMALAEGMLLEAGDKLTVKFPDLELDFADRVTDVSNGQQGARSA